MELRKRGKVWHVDLVDAAGKRVRKTTGRPDKASALRVATRLQQEVWQDRSDALDGKTPITVAQAVDLYAASLGTRASAEGVKSLRAKLIGDPGRYPNRWCLGDTLRLHEVTTQTLADLVQARTKEGNGPQTIAHELKVLRATNRYLSELPYRVSPVTKWRLPKLPQKTRYLSPEEFGQLLARFDPEKARPAWREEWQDIHDLLVALGTTGARWSEIAGLTWQQVGAPRFDRLALWGNKTGRERMGTLTAALRAVLERRWASRRGEGSLVFPARSGGKRRGFKGAPADDTQVLRGPCRAITRAMDLLGFNETVTVARHGRATPHTIRHSFASWVRQSGAGLDEVGKLLGHASPQSTMRYAHLENQAVVDRAAGVLDAIVPVRKAQNGHTEASV